MAARAPTPIPNETPVTDAAPTVRIGAKSSETGNKRTSLPPDTSVRHALFVLANLCDAKEDPTEIIKVVKVVFELLPPQIRVPEIAGVEYEANIQIAIDLICQGFHLSQIVSVLLVRNGLMLSTEDSTAVVRAIEAAVIVHMGLSRDAGQSTSHGALCEAASVVSQYGRRAAHKLMTTYKDAVMRAKHEVPKCIYVLFQHVQDIASEDTEGVNRSTDAYYESIPVRLVRIKGAIEACKRELRATYPDVDDHDLTPAEIKARDAAVVDKLRGDAARVIAEQAKPPLHRGPARAASGGPPVPSASATPEPQVPVVPESDSVSAEGLVVVDPDSGFILTASTNGNDGADGRMA